MGRGGLRRNIWENNEFVWKNFKVFIEILDVFNFKNEEKTEVAYLGKEEWSIS